MGAVAEGAIAQSAMVAPGVVAARSPLHSCPAACSGESPDASRGSASFSILLRCRHKLHPEWSNLVFGFGDGVRRVNLKAQVLCPNKTHFVHPFLYTALLYIYSSTVKLKLSDVACPSGRSRCCARGVLG